MNLTAALHATLGRYAFQAQFELNRPLNERFKTFSILGFLLV